MLHTKRLAALASAGAVILSLLAGASPASADRTPIGATGASSFQLGGPVLKALQANGCGLLTITPLGAAQVVTTTAGKSRAIFPITNFVQADTGAVRIEHGGSGVDLSNTCYDVRLSNFYIQDLGGLQNTVFFDVSARTKSTDESGERLVVFQADVTPSTQIVVARPNAVTFKIKGMDLTLASEGASEFNELATGDETIGPFSAGMLVGKARTSVRLQF
jgi:hypothetical protein